MRNLVLYDLARYDINGGLSGTTDALIVNDTLFLVTNELVYQTELNLLNEFSRYCITDEHKCLTRICFMNHEQKLWFGTGEAFIYYCPTYRMVEVIKSLKEFSAAVWSPSQETLVVVSVDRQVLVYSFDGFKRQLKCLGFCHIDDPITIIPINIGWGSVDTQFRGLSGKLSASENIKKIARNVDDVIPRNVDDVIPRIVWHSKQEYFIINYWTRRKRIFKVFELPCVPVYVCEDTPGLQAPTTWNCTGNTIVCPVYTDKARITVFERNGLSKHSFDLQEQIQVLDLQWNSTGEILAIHQKCNEQSYLSLYKISNNHWYLKQRLDFIKENQLTSFKWTDCSDSIFELTVCTMKQILVYQFINKVSRSAKFDSHGTCAVVDGSKVLIYNFGYAMAALPEANEIIELTNPVCHILFNSVEHEMLIIDCKYRCYLFSYEDKQFVNKQQYDLEILAEYRQYPYNIHHFYWKTDKSLYGIGTSAVSDQADIIFQYDCNFNLVNKDFIRQKINHIEYLNYNDSFLTLCDGGNIFSPDEMYKRFSESLILHLETYICRGMLLLFCLNVENQFYINDVCVAKNITSFLVFSNYLYVTTQDRLYCLRLTLKEIEAVIFTGLVQNCCSRNMEKGGILISGIPNSIGVVLQMPRGNLEVNSCRIAAVDKLDVFLEQSMWTKSFELLRTERLDTNLLVDLNPHRFFQQIKELLINMNSNYLLIGFVVDLIDENILNTKYKSWKFENHPNIDDKKKTVCQAIIDCIIEVDVTAYVKVLMLACITVNGIDLAIKYLRQIHFANPEENASSAIKGLQCLKVYFPKENICAAALSTYDTDFTLFVYLYSSMDPKVYKPLIEEFNAAENEFFRRFKINNYLGLHYDALMYLTRGVGHIYLLEDQYKAFDLNFAIDYATKHALLAELYNMCSATGLFVKEVSLAYASYLCSQQLHKEAGIIFAGAEFYEKALQQYKICNLWQEALIVLDKLKPNENNKLLHVSEIAKGLERCDNYKDASFLNEVYLKDCELAVTTLIKGKLFNEAMRVAQKFEREDLIETVIQPTLKEFVENVFKKLETSHAYLKKNKSRLQILRKKKTETYIAAIEENLQESGDVDNADNQSYAASVSSISTRSARSRISTSSRRRRKEEMKKQNTREGGFYEDIALMRTLHQLITEIFAMGPEVGDVCHLLLVLKESKRAKNLQNMLENVQLDMIQSLPEIWPENLNSFKAEIIPELLALRENIDFLELPFRCPPEVPRKQWKVNLK